MGARGIQPLIVVLGAPNDRRGTLLPMARSRVEEAIRAHRELPGSPLLPTGGHGPHFNQSPWPHHQLLSEALVAGGVDPARILPGVPSTNTVEDARGACERARELAFDQLLVVTSDFHGKRASILFERSSGSDLSIGFRHAHSEDLDQDQLAELRAHEQAAISRLCN